MDDIKIRRTPSSEGSIHPESGRWQLIIDADGMPHLLLRVKVDGQIGWLSVDDLIPEPLSSFIDAEAGAPLPAGDVAEGPAWTGPCPR